MTATVEGMRSSSIYHTMSVRYSVFNLKASWRRVPSIHKIHAFYLTESEQNMNVVGYLIEI